MRSGRMMRAMIVIAGLTAVSGGFSTFEITSEFDDAYEKDNGDVKISRDQISVGREGKDDKRLAGFRFIPLGLPKDAIIVSAFLNAKVLTETITKGTDFIISGEASSESERFTIQANSITDRKRTGNTTIWTEPVVSAGQVISSPDLSSIISEIIELPNWDSSSAITLIIEKDAQADADAGLDFVSFENGFNTLLHIQWDVPTESPTESPTSSPSSSPSGSPSVLPTSSPSTSPTATDTFPSDVPTISVTDQTLSPNTAPSTASTGTSAPTANTNATHSPSVGAGTSSSPSNERTQAPSISTSGTSSPSLLVKADLEPMSSTGAIAASVAIILGLGLFSIIHYQNMGRKEALNNLAKANEAVPQERQVGSFAKTLTNPHASLKV